jgi:hypothetical protein
MPITRQEFEAFFPQLQQEVVQHAASQKFPEQASKWFAEV